MLKSDNLIREIKRITIIIFASFIIALNLNTFVAAGELFPGGVTGLTVLIQRWAETTAGLTLPFLPVNAALNLIPVIIGFTFLGRKFTIYSLLVILLVGIFTDILPHWPITYDLLLISIFGGMANGFAISLCFRAGATAGGTDIIAIFLSERKGRESWNIILAFNAILLLVAGWLFGWDKALYSILFQFATTEVIQTMYRVYQHQTMLIVTTRADEICAAINDISRHGATIIEGTGFYAKERKSIVYSVVSAPDTERIITQVRKIDQNAFINTLNTSHLVGRFYLRPRD